MELESTTERPSQEPKSTTEVSQGDAAVENIDFIKEDVQSKVSFPLVSLL